MSEYLITFKRTPPYEPMTNNPQLIIHNSYLEKWDSNAATK